MITSPRFSFGDFLALCCAIAIGVGFIVLPWFSIFGTPVTGFDLVKASTDLSNASYSGGFSLLWLVPASAIIGGLLALIGLLSVRSSRSISLIILLAGLAGAAYFGIYFLNSNQNALSQFSSQLVPLGAGFWVALIAIIGLIIQVVFPRPVKVTYP